MAAFWYPSAAYQASLFKPWFVFVRGNIALVRPNEIDMPLKCTKKVLMILFNLPHPNLFSHGGIISGQWLDIVEYQDNRHGFWLANNTQLGYGYLGK